MDNSYKNNLRKWAKEERKKLDIEKISKLLVDKLRVTKEYLSANNIMLFYPKSDEINLLNLLKDSSKSFYLPKIEGDNLLCCSYKNGEELCESCFKTQEPLTEPVDKNKIDLIIIPALACDEKNYRLGYGGGFYDRFLKGINATKIACIPKELYIKTVYPDEFDIPMDKVLVV